MVHRGGKVAFLCLPPFVPNAWLELKPPSVDVIVGTVPILLVRLIIVVHDGPTLVLVLPGRVPWRVDCLGRQARPGLLVKLFD